MIIPLNISLNASVLDPDALAFIEEAGVSDSITIRALNTLCRALKTYDIWDSLYVAFPMIFTGVTSSQLLDLKTRTYLSVINPLTGSVVSPTYSYSGIKYNGGQYHALDGNSFNTGIYSATPPGHISIYNRTNHLSLGLTQSSGHGFRDVLNNREQSINFSTVSVSGTLWAASNSTSIFGNTNSSGFFLFSNIDNNFGYTASETTAYNFYLSRNGVALGASSSTNNFQGFFSSVAIGAVSYGNGYVISRSFDEICWYSCGAGFVDEGLGSYIDFSRQEIFYQIIQDFQTSLSRQV